ncbi:hypothetical protein J7J58_07145 [candidate division WOR-3 bacterium]|nr:hypothetical protein [candidate division WOR-3 bacterium]
MSDIVRKEGVKPVRVLILGYLLLIAIGSVFLLLPISHKGHFSVIDSIFTSTSAVCVTGLIVKDTPVFFTPFGKSVLLILIQIGGIGYMSIITLFAMLVGRKMTLQEEMMIKTSYNHVSLDDIGRFALSVLKWTVVFESVGAIIMFWRFMTKYHYSILRSFEKSIFHSVSAFCNAGFSLFSTSLVNFYSDFFIVGTIALLIILGGLGFFVLRDISASFKKRRKISEHSKIVLISTGVLLTVGFLLILLMEYNASLANYNIGGKLFISFFQSVTARTAGFNTIGISSLTNGVLFLIIIFMFIGASPGGTGGGIKTTTFTLLIMGLRALVGSDRRIVILKRNVSESLVNRAFFIFTVSLFFVLLSYFLLLATQGAIHNVMGLLFEELSAFGTVGLSVGSSHIANVSLSADFNIVGKLVIMLSMVFGKIGPFSIAIALMEYQGNRNIQYPQLKMMIG